MNLISKCQICGTNKEYSPEYDAVFCPTCNEWLEDRCSDDNCEYCGNRPETPNGQSSNQ